MPGYRVEVSEPRAHAEQRIEQSVRLMGSHFATHADWRQDRDMWLGSMIVEAADEAGALRIVPPGLRSGARAIRLAPVVRLGSRRRSRAGRRPSRAATRPVPLTPALDAVLGPTPQYQEDGAATRPSIHSPGIVSSPTFDA